jgi:hypothetical protein
MENLKINTSALLKVAPLAAAVAAIINAVLFFIGDATGIMDKNVGIPGPDGSVQAITLVPVIMSSIIPTLVAAGVLMMLNRFTANPMRIFGIVTIVILVVSMGNPFMGIPGISTGMGIWLDLMHVVVAGVAWYAFSRYTKSK